MAPHEPSVDVVICTYRSQDHIGACLAGLRDGGAVIRSVTVVDNDSGDDTVARVATADPAARVVQMGRNAGFASAVNRGIRRGGARYVLVLNPDTVVARGALRTLVAFADEHPAAGVVAPRLLNGDGSDQLTARAFPTPAAGLFGRRSPMTRLFPDNRWSARFLPGRRHTGDEPFEVDWVSGAAMLVPRGVIDRVGPLDDGFFLFWEDADWCHRIKDAGYGVWCVPAASVLHHEGGSRGHGWSRATITAFHRGAYRYWRKHHAPQPWNPMRWLAAALLAARAALLLARVSVTGPLPDRRPQSVPGKQVSAA
jgi:N-acetylglucosaminyl-diphospho-decaprenol L-rhamnosyltransferase